MPKVNMIKTMTRAEVGRALREENEELKERVQSLDKKVSTLEEWRVLFFVILGLCIWGYLDSLKEGDLVYEVLAFLLPTLIVAFVCWCVIACFVDWVKAILKRRQEAKMWEDKERAWLEKANRKSS